MYLARRFAAPLCFALLFGPACILAQEPGAVIRAPAVAVKVAENAPILAQPKSDLQLSPAEMAWLAKHPVIRVAPEQDYPPFIFADGPGMVRGLSADMLARIAEQLGLRIEYLPAAPLDMVLQSLRAVEADVVTSLRSTPERAAFLNFTTPYVDVPAVLLLRRDYKGPRDLDEFTSERIAVGRSYAVETYLRRNFPSLNLQAQTDDAVSLRMLAFGGVEAAVMDLASASWLSQREGIANLFVAGDVGFSYPLSFGVRKDWPEFTQIMTKGLAGVSMAERQEIQTRWIGLRENWAFRWQQELMMGGGIMVSLLAIGLGVGWWRRSVQRAVAHRTTLLENEVQLMKRVTKDVKHIAEHDPLTGLPSRLLFYDRVEQAISAARRNGRSVGVICLDVDDFAGLNDRHGHATGDLLLREVSHRAVAALRSADTVCRLSADKFVLLLHEIESAGSAVIVTEKLRNSFAQSIDVAGRSIELRVCQGIALYPLDGQDAETLIQRASEAMYLGRGSAAGFHPWRSNSFNSVL